VIVIPAVFSDIVLDNFIRRFYLQMGFRPCIDLLDGRVVQIVGGSLTVKKSATKVNFETVLSPAYYANLYREDNLRGGHVISLDRVITMLPYLL
jgi:hypothetical protein